MCPWRPADLEQREGRIIRQGNQNDEIEILGYVVESSYDTVMWQKVEAKTLFIEQVRRNEVNDLEIEDLSGGRPWGRGGRGQGAGDRRPPLPAPSAARRGRAASAGTRTRPPRSGPPARLAGQYP
jgi:hypothetical protein